VLLVGFADEGVTRMNTAWQSELDCLLLRHTAHGNR